MKNKYNKQFSLSRRQFLKISSLSLLGGCKSFDNYLIKKINEIDLQQGEFIKDLQKYVVYGETKPSYGEEEKIDELHIQKGAGIIFKDYYLTLSHIVDMSNGIPNSSPFGTFYYKPDKNYKFSTYINNEKLEKIAMNNENDVAIFKLSNKLTSIKKMNFPLTPKTNLLLGEKIAIIGNPRLKGPNSRTGRITDLDGLVAENLDRYRKAIGVDIPFILGDSGAPIVSLLDKTLIGIAGLKFESLGYFQKIEYFLDEIYKYEGKIKTQSSL